jgi:2'-5' RNA ligase
LYRLLVAIDLPPEIKQRLALISCGLPGALWANADQLHLTVRYIGAVDGGVFTDVCDMLKRVRAEPFQLMLRGIGFFPLRRTPESVWVGVSRSEDLILLRNRVNSAVTKCGLGPERRKYAPHVTLGRFGGGPVRTDNPRRLAEYLREYSLFQTEPFTVDRFHLYSSSRSHQGPLYRSEAVYPLSSKGVVLDEDVS